MPNPLVSICVITYHSEKFVLETLESAKTQTYQNIELIISDDGSTDSTIQLCRDWLAENKDRFVRTELITVEKNTGIPANCNRAVKAAHGEWIKLIAGDDILLDNCVETLVDFAIKTPDAYFIFSDIIYIDDNSVIIKKQKIIDTTFFELDSKEQYLKFIFGKNTMIPAVTSFIKKKAFERLNYFDEEIKLCEDYPFWLKATKNNFKLNFLNQELVKYRQHTNSIMSGFKKSYQISMKKVFFKYRFKDLLKYRPGLAIQLFIFNTFRKYEFYHKIRPYFLLSNYIKAIKKPTK
jgi:alpha-1,3-rhamnosyltransferase